MQTPHPHLITGIGGSAGGLQAYMELLDALSPDTGMAFVIISHVLPTTTHSLLADILSGHTKMPVKVAAEAMPVRMNHVYVIPPNADLLVENYAFKVRTPRTMNKQVDIFFRSLSEAMGERAIGIVLSGYDGDGAEGCAQIKARGGTTFAQDRSAKVDAMPLSAQNSGWVDFVLPPDKMAVELRRLAGASRMSLLKDR
jgi:two-component system CheB/CheR fusion protein